MLKKFHLIAQVVGYAALMLLAVYGLVTLLGGGPAMAAALDAVRTAGANPDIPATFNYQGFMRNPDGSLMNGTYTLTAKIYTAPVAGSALYTETFPSVSVRDGLFNIVLGSNPQGQNLPAVFSTAPRYIGIALGEEAELIPRQRVHGVPWALYATNAITATHATNATNATNFTASGTITATNIAWTGHLRNMVVGPRQWFDEVSPYQGYKKIADLGNRICWLAGYWERHEQWAAYSAVEHECTVEQLNDGWYLYMKLRIDGSATAQELCSATCLSW